MRTHLVQDGSEGTDVIYGATVCDETSVFLGGYTSGEWATSNAGGNDFAVVQLNLTDGTELWRWQVCKYERYFQTK